MPLPTPLKYSPRGMAPHQPNMLEGCTEGEEAWLRFHPGCFLLGEPEEGHLKS